MPLSPEAKKRIQGKIPSKPKAEATDKTPSPPPPLPPSAKVYFNQAKANYMIQNHQGEWMGLTESSIGRVLRSMGFAGLKRDGSDLDDKERELMRIQMEANVHFAGEIAGYPVGPCQIGSHRVLITNEAKPLKPKEGKYPTLNTFLKELFGSQAAWVKGWLQSALISLKAGPPWRPGQLLALAGPKGCGKSLFQNLVTEMLGGRTARPWAYLTGESNFNSQLLAAEHLIIEDEASSTDMRTRRHLGQMLKNMLVNQTQQLHAKGKDAITVTPFWRLTMSLNDEPDHLMCLPPMDESMKDKVILVKCSPVTIPYAPEQIDERQKWGERLYAELPAFLYALQRWPIPTLMRDVRFGIKAYQHEGLMNALDEISPHMRLLNLIDSLELIQFTATHWQGTAHQLENELREKDKNGEVARLLSYNTACGQYLSMLAKRFPERFGFQERGGRLREWMIYREGTVREK